MRLPVIFSVKLKGVDTFYRKSPAIVFRLAELLFFKELMRNTWTPLSTFLGWEFFIS